MFRKYPGFNSANTLLVPLTSAELLLSSNGAKFLIISLPCSILFSGGSLLIAGNKVLIILGSFTPNSLIDDKAFASFSFV